MTKQELIKFILKWEGGYACIPGDSGGATNKGVTIGTFRAVFGQSKTVEDLKRLTDGQWMKVFDKVVWSKIQGDRLPETIACMIADWAWHSGVTTAVKYAQACVGGLTADGVLGEKSVAALNRYGVGLFVSKYCSLRRKYLLKIAGYDTSESMLLLAKSNPRKIQLAWSRDKDRKFIVGWLNRVNALEVAA